MNATAQNASTPPVLDLKNGIARVTLNRPKQHNRLEPVDLKVLTDMFAQIAADPGARVLILTGVGKSFSSGFHLGALKDRSEGQRDDYDPNAFERMVNALEDLSVPTIARLNGGVYGGATDLALACDFRIGVDTCRMFMPAARLGIVYYEGGLRRYVTRLGLDNAKKLFLTGATIEAEEMLRMGYLHEVVALSDLDARVDARATELVANAPMSLAATKKSLNDIARGTFDSKDHRARQDQCATSQDHREGMQAWAERRAPVFQGK